MTSSDRFQQYAGLLCDVGLNLEPGQDVAVNAQIEHAELARAVAEHAYAHGAHYVDIWYWDPHAKTLPDPARAHPDATVDATLARRPLPAAGGPARRAGQHCRGPGTRPARRAR